MEKSYIGGGRYGSPKLIWSNFYPEKGEFYPQDGEKRYIVDCSKVK